MAKNTISMPQSGAGLTSFRNDDASKIKIKPSHVIIFVAIVAILVLLLHLFGDAIFGINAVLP